MPANKLSFLVDAVVPGYVKNNHAGYVTLVKSYFEYLEREFGEYDVAVNLLEYRDIDSTVDAYIDEFRREFAHELPENTSANLKLLIKKIREFYKSKGSEGSFKFLFRAVYNSSAEFYYPATGTLKTSTKEHKLSDTNAHLTDSNYWQDFSYVLRTGVSGHIYEKLVYAMAHPAGMKLFSEFKPSADVVTGNIPSLTDTWIVLIILDYIISALVPTHIETIADRIFDTSYGASASFTNYLWNSDLSLDVLADTIETSKINTIDGQSQEQQLLLFYNRKKQDINSFKSIGTNVTLFAAGENTALGWDGVPGSANFTVPATWYSTPLRTQPSASDDIVYINNLYKCAYGYTQKTDTSNTFNVWSAIASLNNGLFFVNGNKIVESDLSLSAPIATGIMAGGRVVTVASNIVNLNDNIEYYVIDNTTEEFTVNVVGDLVLTTTAANKTFQVYAEGQIIYDDEYHVAGNTITISSVLWGSVITTGSRLEVVVFNYNKPNMSIKHIAALNQKNFALKRNAELNRHVVSELVII